jgi:hypothetical protein
VCCYAYHFKISGLDRRAGLRWVGIETSELLLPRQYTAPPRMLRLLSVIFANIPEYRFYTESKGNQYVFAISLQLPLSLLSKLLPTRHTISLLKHTTVLQIPKFLLLPQALSVVATSLCLSEKLTECLLNHLDAEKILSLVLVKLLEVWTHGSSKSMSKTHELRSIESSASSELLFCPSVSFRIDAISSLSCVLALESYSQLFQRIGVCCRSFSSRNLQLIATLLACATSACMPVLCNLESNRTNAPQLSNFQPRHAAFLGLRLTSPLDIVAQTFSCLRAAAKFSPAISVLLHSPYSNYNFSVDESVQIRLNRVLKTNREPFYLNSYAVWKSTCDVLAEDFNHSMFSPFKLAVRWLRIIHFSSGRSRCHFHLHSGVRSPAQIDPDRLKEPDIFDALRTEAASVESIAFSCMEIFSLVSLKSEGRDWILSDEAATRLVIDICSQNHEENSFRVFILTVFHNFSLQPTNQSLELLLRPYVLDFLKDSLMIRNVEVLQICLQTLSNTVQRLAWIGKTSPVILPIFKHFWDIFQDSFCSRIVAAALHPVPAIMRAAICSILNACAPGNPPKIRRFIASSGFFSILQQILSHPQKNLKLFALGTVTCITDGDVVESLRWSEACSTIINAGNTFLDKGPSVIDAHIRFLTLACIHNLSIEPLCWDNGLDDMKVQEILSSAKKILTLEAPN